VGKSHEYYSLVTALCVWKNRVLHCSALSIHIYQRAQIQVADEKRGHLNMGSRIIVHATLLVDMRV
jgi:hypothetical protein